MTVKELKKVIETVSDDFEIIISADIGGNRPFKFRKLEDISVDIGYLSKVVHLWGIMTEADLATIAYMQGAERCKTKWHKVAEGDLPKHTRYVWTNVGPSYYDDDRDCPCWRDEFGRTQGVIAWCEPKFKE